MHRFLPKTIGAVAWSLTWLASTGSRAALAATPTSPSMAESEIRGQGQPLSRKWIDLDGDEKLDLVVVTGSASRPLAEGEDSVESLVAYLKVTPSFLDKRQALLFRQTAAGFVPWGGGLPLPGDTAAVDVADLDGDGRPEVLFAAGFRVYAFARKGDAETYPVEPRTVCDAEMLLGYTRSFIPSMRLAAALVEGRPPALILSTPAGLEIRDPREGGAVPASADLVLRSGIRSVQFDDRQVMVRESPPRIVDADGDGSLDILFERDDELVLFRAKPDGGFEQDPHRVRLPGPRKEARPSSRAIEDVDGDGRLDLVSFLYPQVGDEAENGKKAKDLPLATIEVRLGLPGFRFPEAPDRSIDLPRNKKYQGGIPSLMKIDADGRADLVLLRFTTSLWQVARVLVTKKISFDVSYETRLQSADGLFPVPRGKPFETTVTLDLKRGINGLPTEPRGDFNGDGIVDLVDFSDGPDARVHLTSSEGVFSEKPSWIVPLRRAPEDRALVDVEDVDGDGRSDVAFFNLDGTGFVGTILRSAP